MGGTPEKIEDLGPIVREKTLDLKLELLNRSLTLKIVAAFFGTQALSHFSLPSELTAGAFLAVVAKLTLLR